ncbi:MAG TPA: isocitrate lyase/phosphoenolpyruvate mutase family protein [Rhizomicrobium sp.]|jgi:2-methylisocitrate lyase-like PEP mutase family enzyme|nr:isocitrate lyase/phosphoenolpyruvate mutase family protein [Rhizomicrobium sp.]
MSAQQTVQFRALHGEGRLLILPNAWGAGSARLIEDCGAEAIATSSAAFAWAHGYPDGEALPVATFLPAVAEILRVVKVPVSVDSETGFSDTPEGAAQFVGALIERGVSGINLEDGHGSPELLVAKIKAIKAEATRKGGDIFINARADVYLKNLAAPEKMLTETIARGLAYTEAGADGFFAPGVFELSDIRAIVSAVSLPLNILVWPGLASIAELKAAGVRRVSAGSGTSRAANGALRRATTRLLEDGLYDTMLKEGEDAPKMNALLPGI